jgi:hypothetical protein
MLSDVEEKITLTEIDQLTGQQTIRVSYTYRDSEILIVVAFIDIKEKSFVDIR